MPLVHLLADLPEGVSLARVRRILEAEGITLHACSGEGDCPPLPPLSRAERCVLRAFTVCETNEEIARELGVSVPTVKSHVRSIFAKLGVKSRCVALGKALRLGLVSLNEVLRTEETTSRPL